MKTHRFGWIVLAVCCSLPAGFAVRGEEAAPPAAPAPAVVVQPAAEADYLGIWKVQDGKAREFFIELKAGGVAASKWAAAAEQNRNEVGTWKLVGGAAHIVWGNGWREVISRTGEGFVKKAFAPALSLEGKPSNQSSAVKVDAIPTT